MDNDITCETMCNFTVLTRTDTQWYGLTIGSHNDKWTTVMNTLCLTPEMIIFDHMIIQHGMNDLKPIE